MREKDSDNFSVPQRSIVTNQRGPPSADHNDTNTDEEEIERLLEAERLELDELVAMHDTVAAGDATPMHHASPDDDSDDAAMDEIFQELFDHHMMHRVSGADGDGDGDAMDMSSG